MTIKIGMGMPEERVPKDILMQAIKFDPIRVESELQEIRVSLGVDSPFTKDEIEEIIANSIFEEE